MVDRTGLEGTLYLDLDPESLRMIQQQLAGTFTGQMAGSQATGTPTTPGAPGTPSPSSTQLEGAMLGAQLIQKQQLDLQLNKDKEDKAHQDKMAGYLGSVNTGISMGIGAFTGIMNIGLEFIEKIWKLIVEYSPGLKAILELFGTALELFFLPIGTAIMMTIMPIMTQLLDNVINVMGLMWDAFEEGGLPAMLRVAFEQAVPLFFDTIYSVIQAIPEDIPMLRAIKGILMTIFNFIERSGVDLVITLLKLTEITVAIMGFLLTHLPIFGALIGTIIGLQIAQIIVTATSGSMAGLFGAGIAVAGVATAGALAGGYIQYGMAEGGTVPATPGGQWKLLGEGGEDEFVVPRSKTQSFASAVQGGGASVVVNVQGNVYANDLKEIVVNAVNQEMNMMRGRSTF